MREQYPNYLCRYTIPTKSFCQCLRKFLLFHAMILNMGRRKLGRKKFEATFPPALLDELDSIARSMNRTRSDLLESAVRTWLASNSQKSRPKESRERRDHTPRRGI